MGFTLWIIVGLGITCVVLVIIAIVLTNKDDKQE